MTLTETLVGSSKCLGIRDEHLHSRIVLPGHPVSSRKSDNFTMWRRHQRVAYHIALTFICHAINLLQIISPCISLWDSLSRARKKVDTACEKFQQQIAGLTRMKNRFHFTHMRWSSSLSFGLQLTRMWYGTLGEVADHAEGGSLGIKLHGQLELVSIRRSQTSSTWSTVSVDVPEAALPNLLS